MLVKHRNNLTDKQISIETIQFSEMNLDTQNNMNKVMAKIIPNQKDVQKLAMEMDKNATMLETTNDVLDDITNVGEDIEADEKMRKAILDSIQEEEIDNLPEVYYSSRIQIDPKTDKDTRSASSIRASKNSKP